jgi:hypothetical protein
MNEKQMINPNWFTADAVKFQPMHRPKRYIPVLRLHGVAHLVRHDYCSTSFDGMYKTKSAALGRAVRVRQRWVRLYAVAVGGVG